MGKKLLLINDMAGYGKVSLGAMIPVLSHMGHHIFNLPTALVSNTLDYGKFRILETTDYMKDTLKVWGELGFTFDAVSTGFIVSDEQAKIVARYCTELKARGATVFVDPIMGDEGRLYNGVSEETIEHLKRMVSVSDYILPNYTEACYLAGEEYLAGGMSFAQADELVRGLRELGAKNIVVTSAVVDGHTCTLVYDYREERLEFEEYSHIPVHFPGTGDLFSAIFIGDILDGVGLQEATRTAMDTVARLIDKNRDNEDKYKGIQIESFLEEITGGKRRGQ